MKFEDKLINLRKNRKMSQEQLADELNVSRQAVSKWESGASYPEMDKLIQLAKIFNCTLDDLTNDEITSERINSNKEKNPLNDVLGEIESFINKSVKMFSNMKSQEIVKLVLFMFLVGIFLLIIKVPINKLYNIGEGFFINFGDTPGRILSGFWNFILEIVYLIATFVLFIYIYKAKYLDKFKEVKQEEVVDFSNDLKEEKAEKVKQAKGNKSDKGWGILKILGMIFMFFIKCFTFFFTIPFIFLYVFIVFGLFISIYLVFNEVIFFGVIVLLISGIILITWFLELVFDFMFNKPINNKMRIFITFMVGLLLFGIGSGITALEISKIKLSKDIPNYYKSDLLVEELDYNENLYFGNIYNVEFIPDATLTNKIKIEINYYDELSTPRVLVNDNSIDIYSMDDEFSMDFIKNLIKDLKDKTIYNYNLITNYRIVVYTSEKNINALKENYEKQAIENERYQEDIWNYQRELATLEESIQDLEIENQELQEDIDTCNYKLEDYKNRVSSILDE